jgi:hypothetical protein
MSEFSTYRVRHGEWQTFAINVSARSAEDACELARQIRGAIGQEPFEEMDGAIEKFEAEELTSGGATSDPFPEFPSALDLIRRQGGAS